jgi:hypothetical protein
MPEESTVNKPKTNYKVEIRIAEKSIKTDFAIKAQGTYLRWCYTNYSKDDESLSQFELPYFNMEDIGSVFIYLVKVDDGAFGTKETRVAYSRLAVTEF